MSDTNATIANGWKAPAVITPIFRMSDECARLALTFGAELRRLRNETGLSQSKFADRVGVDHAYVSRLEAGRRRPARDMVFRVALEFGLSIDRRNELLAAAFGVDLRPAELRDPDCAALIVLLADTTIPEEIRAQMRETLRSMVALWTSFTKTPVPILSRRSN